jgi:hypothetical protein
MMAMSGMALATGMIATGVSRFGRRPDLARKLGIGGFVFIIACAIAFTGTEAQRTMAVSFNPSMSADTSNDTAGANADSTINFSLPEDSLNFAGVTSFTPAQYSIVNCTSSTAAASCADDVIPNGAYAGRLDATATLGVLNNACNNSLATGFDLMDATTNMGSTTVYQDSNGNGQGEQFEDSDGNGIPNGAEAYPDYLTRLVRDEPFPGGSPAQPIQRLYGQTNVAQTDVSLNFLIFAPGTKINGVANDAALGYPSVALLQNTGDPEGIFAPTAITDFCTPLETSTTTFGVTRDNPNTGASEGGTTNRTNPGDGGYTFVVFTRSQNDADADGIENALDPCPTEGNPDGWDPREPGAVGDTDGDGLPNVCDPSALTVTDEDGDGWPNRGDNCPLIANADAKDVDQDGLGDACDPNPSSPTGDFKQLCLKSAVNIGAGGSAQDPTSAPPCGTQASTPPPTDAPAETPAPTETAAASETPAAGSETPAASGGATETPIPSGGTSETPAATDLPIPSTGASGTPAPSGDATPAPSGEPAPTATGGPLPSVPVPTGAASGTPAASAPVPSGTAPTPTPTGGAPLPTATPISAGQSPTTEAPAPTAAPTAPAGGNTNPTAAPTAPAIGGATNNSIGGVGPAKLPNTGGFPSDSSTSSSWIAVIAALLLMTGVALTLHAGGRREN